MRYLEAIYIDKNKLVFFSLFKRTQARGFWATHGGKVRSGTGFVAETFFFRCKTNTTAIYKFIKCKSFKEFCASFFELKFSLATDAGGMLIHCITGWDRTPLFISLLRMSLWADGVIHESLDDRDIAYLTLAYDWYLFG